MKQYLHFAFILLSLSTSAQQASLDNSLRKLVDASPSQEVIRIFVKGDLTSLRGSWSNYGATEILHSGDIVSIAIPMNRVGDLALDPHIERIEWPNAPGVLMNDRMVINNNVWQVHEGQGALPQAYKGNVVIVGIIDSGIDFDHPDFRNANGTSRVKWLWDQNYPVSSNTPSYGYGQEWDNGDIDLNLCPHVDPSASFGHGTNVSGIAVGNGLALNALEGVASESDIIVVAFKSQGFLTSIADGVDYIFAKADQLGKPCVINISAGTYAGSHDGLDLTAQFIDGLLEAQAGRVVVAAAGNAGNIPFHLGYDVTADTNFTWFQNLAGFTTFEFWADEADFNNVDFAFGAFNNANKTDRGRTSFINLIDDLNMDVNTSNTYSETVMMGANPIGTVDIDVEKSFGRYQVQVQITPDSTTYLWSLMMTGLGHFDLWSGASYTGTSNMVTSGLPTSAQYPKIVDYKLPDVNQTMVSSWQCSDKVITVANYTNRSQFLNFNGTVTTTTEVAQDIALTSSWGPSRTGLMKPDVTATGNFTLTAGPKYLLDVWKGSNPTLLAQGGMHSRNGGTSLASPVVAGIAALFLDRYPNATYSQVKDAIVMTCHGDNFTGNLPNARWGYGKVHAYDALTAEMGCTDPVAANFNPFALVDDSSCTYLRLGVEGLAEEAYLAVRPNPVTTTLTMAYRLPEPNAQLILTDITGRQVAMVEVSSTKGQATLDASMFDAGVYLLTVNSGGSALASEKVVIIR